MKQLLLLFLAIPCSLIARVDPRIPKTAPYDGVKSMQATYIFVIKSGNDTSITETFRYNEYGYLTNYDYDLHMMKNPPYQMRSVYSYQSQDAWIQTTYKNNKITDSAIVKGGRADHYWWSGGKVTQINEFRGDSFAEKNIVNLDTVFVHGDSKASLLSDPFWDYRNAGKFANKSLTRSADTDTTRYLNDKGECLVMIVNYYDNNFRPVKTDYFNYKVKRFDLMYLPYNERMDMTFFLNKSRKGHWSYEITRKFNEKGWLTEEYFTDARPYKGANGTPMIRKYEYTTY